jgi:1-deoxy-D-xylulose-5-phosphate synthase
VIERINSPRDLAALSNEQLATLAQEIRDFLIEKVSKTGGHLGPNLGVVELTIALHRVFESPKDVILFDTGHQSYVHKILTGRANDFDNLRQRGGLSGYPSRKESVHDVIENSHASTCLSWADGISKGFELSGQDDRTVVAVVGDGALTGGMSWEALNNIAADDDRKLVIVVNDNTRSYSPTIGGLASHLATLRLTKGYEKFLDFGKAIIKATPVVGDPLYSAVHGMKKGIKDFIAPQGMFEDLGLKYYGPIDGHNIEELEEALKRAKSFGGPVIIHCITEKGRGYQPAIEDEAERFHAVGVVNPETGMPVKAGGTSWTKVFGEELVEQGKKNPKIVAITAAMMGPTGLNKFQANFPERTIDVGIAEQHALTSAAGLAYAGMHPVVAVYSTFLNRAFDQLLLDVAMHKAGVTLVLDRAGVTGDDGPSHHGIWDLALGGIVPTLSIAAPRDAHTLREELQEAVAINDAPTLIRFPKGEVIESVPALRRQEGLDILLEGATKDLLIISVGAMAKLAVDSAKLIGATVVDPRWVKPINPALLKFAAEFQSVLVIEDGIKHGGIASSLAEAGLHAESIGIPLEFIEHSKRDEILNDLGINAATIAARMQHLVRGI